MDEERAGEIVKAGDWAVRQSLDEVGDTKGSAHLLRAIYFIESHPEGLPSGNQRMVYAAWRMSCAKVEERHGLPEGSIRSAVRDLLGVGMPTRASVYGPKREARKRKELEEWK